MSAVLSELPAPPHPNKVEWSLATATQTFESPLTGAVSTHELSGTRWTVRLTYSSLAKAEARILQGFLFSRRGAAGRFKFYVPGAEPFGEAPDKTNYPGLPAVVRTAKEPISLAYVGKDGGGLQPISDMGNGRFVSWGAAGRQHLHYVSGHGSAFDVFSPQPPPVAQINGEWPRVDRRPFGVFRLKDDVQARVNLTGSGMLGSATFEIVEGEK